jgi:hypothetical protein
VISKRADETWHSAQISEEQSQRGVPISAIAEQKKKEKEDEKKTEGRKETGAKVGPPAIGAVAGLAVLQAHENKSAITALLVAALAWAVSWFIWNFAVTTTSKKGMQRDTVTEIDWTEIRVLERRFPALIHRVKDAGFAPIFVFDELDKLRDPAQQIDDFMRLTKHLVTDEAAFFFLVNRDYFERVERLDLGLPVDIVVEAAP